MYLIDCTHQHLASQRNSIYSTISTLRFQLLPCTWTLKATNMFEVSTQTQFKVSFCSYSLTTGAPSTRPQSTQYVGRWWHHDSAVAAAVAAEVRIHAQFQYQFSTSAVGYTDQTSRLYRPVLVVSNLCSNSSCPCVSNLFVCVQYVWVMPFWRS